MKFDAIEKNLNLKSIIDSYIEDFNNIAKMARKDNLSEEKIEEFQERYLESILLCFLKAVDIPKEIKLKIVKDIQVRVEKDEK